MAVGVAGETVRDSVQSVISALTRSLEFDGLQALSAPDEWSDHSIAGMLDSFVVRSMMSESCVEAMKVVKGESGGDTKHSEISFDGTRCYHLLQDMVGILRVYPLVVKGS